METVFCEDIPLDRNREYYEFSIGKAGELRCSEAIEDRECGDCESCLLTHSILSTRNWFWRCSHQVKKQFLVGLIQRFHSVDLLKYTVQLLKPLISKDFTYARNRTIPSLDTDQAQASSDRALSMNDIQTSIKHTWNWFVSSNYWTKSNFLLALFQMCDTHLLFLVGNHAKTLLSSEVKALAHKDEQFDARVSSAIASAHSHYIDGGSPTHTAPSVIRSFSRNHDADSRLSSVDMRGESAAGEIINDESEDEDPTLYISPSSEKALVGVTKYIDFIKQLPVHLSKYILGFLDEAALFNCSRVSQHWNVLVEEMKAEFYANQQMWEDIMLMQGSSGVHPNYANDIDILVPNVKQGSFYECIKLEGDPDPKVLKDDRFKSEMNFENAYKGYSIRRVIMEERNVYCGSYNVLVLVSEQNKDRVIHTCGGIYLAYSKDRRCHLIDISTGGDTNHPIAGHSGPIRCINIQEDEGFLLTGSFDTSIRKWSLKTLKCTKIFNGHQDTVVALDYCAKSKQFASASLDKSCKVWDVDSKKCWRTFKHRGKVVAVALSESQCITGCEQGRVKVWDLETGRLIKMLLGHDKTLTALRFDKWHIITSSLDGYALVWSNQGNHKRCLTALRHPCPVLCLEFTYLRVITGAEDGRVRIWNIINGQCCRIMRGNSQSDPVLSIYMSENRLTINTKTNVLMLTFENIDWDYSYESDKVITYVDHNKYPSTPLKQYPYSYIRAQRMAHSGSADVRLLNKTEKPRFSRATSALSATSSFSPESLKNVPDEPSRKITLKEEPDVFPTEDFTRYQERSSVARVLSAPSLTKEAGSPYLTHPQLEKRRVSWAFEHPEIPSCDNPTLDEMKSLLKKQIRSTTQTPDFIYLSISALKNQAISSYPYEYSKNSDFPAPPKQQLNSASTSTTKRPILRHRPQSSPSSIDTKTKVAISDSLEELLEEQATSTLPDDTKSIRSALQSRSGRTTSPARSVRSSISRSRKGTATEDSQSALQRAQSAQAIRVRSAGIPRCQSAESWKNKASKRLPSRTRHDTTRHDTTRHGLSTTATEASVVPMLMYPKEGLKPKVNTTQLKKWPSQESVAQRHPMNSTKSLMLKTYTQQLTPSIPDNEASRNTAPNLANFKQVLCST